MTDAAATEQGQQGAPILCGVAINEQGIAWLYHEASDVERWQWGYEVCEIPYETVQRDLVEGGVTFEQARELIAKAYQWAELAKLRIPSLIISACIKSAMVTADETMPEMQLAGGTLPSSPRFPTGLPQLDELLDGGLYGVAAISGAPKVGKSLLALAVSLAAVRAGWTVLYANAEMTRATMTNRLIALCGGFISPEVRASLVFFSVCRGVKLKTIQQKILGALDMDTQRLLVVVDSVNTTAEMMLTSAGDGNYWNALRDLGHLAMASRRSSEGKCSWLLVSEQNQRGELKGLKLQYTADVVVSMKAGNAQDRVEISVPYARESRGGQVGTFVRDWRSGRFTRLLETPIEEDPHDRQGSIL